MVSVQLISHASVVIEACGVRILTDPWLEGKAFNNSWGLIAEPAAIDFDSIDYLWISHEHPDHFHIPSLKSLPPDFKERVTVLFQRSSDYPKMLAALAGLGFPNVRLLPHKQWVRLGEARRRPEASHIHAKAVNSLGFRPPRHLGRLEGS